MAKNNKGTGESPNPPKNGVGNETLSREAVFTRELNAPRERVFKVWTDPKLLAQWWGPRGFTNPVCESDPRPGGAIFIHMRGPDGKVYPMAGVFNEVVKPSRIVFSNTPLDEKGNPIFEVLTTVSLAEEGGRTRLTVRAKAEKTPVSAAPMLDGMEEGWSQSLDRLSEKVARTAGESLFVISRAYEASRELLFRAWTEPEHMKNWWGPKGGVVLKAKMDFRPGGTYHYGMQLPDGTRSWGNFVYREIVKPERLVWVNSFADENGAITSHPLSPNWPREILTTVTFTEQSGKTAVSIQWVPINATDVEKKTFEEGRQSMLLGWGGSLDQLKEYLAGIKA